MMLSAFAAEGCAAAPLLLSAGAPCINRRRCAIEIDIACPPGTQQQTHRTQRHGAAAVDRCD